MSWSPREDWIAVSTFTRLSLWNDAGGRLRPAQDYPLAGASPELSALLQWSPDGRRLLYAQDLRTSVATGEVDLDSRAAAGLGAGFAAYGPGGDWLLWQNSVSLGRREEVVFDRQSRSGAKLPLPSATLGVLAHGTAEEAAAGGGSGSFDLIPALSDNAELPLCPQRQDRKARRTEVFCLDSESGLARRAVLPTAGRVFPSRDRSLFAAVEEVDRKPPRLAVYDSRGRLKADGAGFVRFIGEKTDAFRADPKANPRVSRLAWSPDGTWIAWVVEGRLCLWDWRSDQARIAAARD